ncbi:ATP-binding protein [Halohasta salina]|uniref:ATP-binding protein n=1 Tax=Halohasta salina TaxID=2961621 RepID=UPI0020A5FEE2|nr:ATP-binding protein [Halohasta salina]
MSYATTHDHLRAELVRIETVIEAHDGTERSVETADSTAVDSGAPPEPASLSLAVAAETRAAIREQTETIRQECRDSECRLRLRVLADVCGLSRRHLDVLMLAMAPVLDAEHADRFRRATNDRSLSRPTVEYIRTLFGRTPSERLAAGRLVDRNSPLCTHGLIELHAPPHGTDRRANRLVVPSGRVVEYLSGDNSPDPALVEEIAAHNGVGVVDCEADTTVDELAVSDRIGQRVATLAARDGPTRCYWYGPASEKHRAVAAVCADRYLQADLGAVLAADVLDWLCREAALLGRPLCLTNATAATDHAERTTRLEAVFDTLADLDTSVFVTGSEEWTPTGTMSTDVDAIVEFPYPSVDLRRAFWRRHAAALPDEVDPGVLAGTFRLTHEGLRAALSTARSVAEGGELTAADVYRGCRAQSTGELDDLADRIEPDSEWDDIELRAETESKLRLVGTHIAQQGRIYDEWGFAERFSRGQGVVALFEGPSGTGKTMAAELLAGEVGMALYRVDLSAVVSKYIGETEANLEAIFEAATNANAVLLFDEADAVFGERGEVSDSTDRYANAEVNYLLQRIESYDGVVLLTTNYASGIDSAFQRRLDHTVSFTKPQASTRRSIWKGMFPDDAPVGDLDYAFLSEFEFTGGRIQTICRTAAIRAADEAHGGEPTIEMRHLVGAIRQAVEASGRMVDPSAFEPYRGLLDDEPTVDSDDSPAEPPTDAVDRRNQAPDRSPEAVVEAFVDRLNDGDPAVDDLYHARAVTEPVSRKDLRRATTVDHGIVGDIERLESATDRVVLAFTHRRDGCQHRTTVELRREDGRWRLFDLERSESAAAP